MPQLASAYFAGNARLQQAAGAGLPLAQGETGTAVTLMQSGLADLGYLMPRSTRPDSGLDGVFGAETLTIV